MARQLALHSNLASVIHRKLSQNQEPYASNWLERLRAIKRLRLKLVPESVQSASGSAASGGLIGLPVTSQDLSDSLGVTLPTVVNSQTTHGTSASTGHIAAGVSTKRTSFPVDDFTEYIL